MLMDTPDGPYHGVRIQISPLRVVTATVPFFADTFEDIFRIYQTYPTFMGLPRSTRADADVMQRQAGSYDVTITYEGLIPGDEPDKEENQTTWRLEPHWSEEPIESHYLYNQIKEYYGGFLDEGDRIKFPEMMPEKTRLAGKKSPFSKGVPLKNPMFGMETYFQTGCEVEVIEIVRSLPRDTISKLNRVQKTPPVEDLQAIDFGDRNWFVMAPSIAKRGNFFEVTRKYKLSAPGGWPPTAALVDQR